MFTMQKDLMSWSKKSGNWNYRLMNQKKIVIRLWLELRNLKQHSLNYKSNSMNKMLIT